MEDITIHSTLMPNIRLSHELKHAASSVALTHYLDLQQLDFPRFRSSCPVDELSSARPAPASSSLPALSKPLSRHTWMTPVLSLMLYTSIPALRPLGLMGV